MNKDTHVAVGLAAATAVMTHYQSVSMTGLICGSLAAVCGAIMPDTDLLDNRTAKITDMLTYLVEYSSIPVMLVIYCWHMGMYTAIISYKDFQAPTAFIYAAVWEFVVAAMVPSPHRGYSHSIAALMITTWVWSVTIPVGFSRWYMIGFISHLAIDLLNNTGERLLFPLKQKYCFKLCKTNGIIAQICKTAGMAGYIAILMGVYNGTSIWMF